MATKLSQIASGGAVNPATDALVAVRSGTTDVLVTPGTAAAKSASDNTKAGVASVSGATTSGHLAVFADAAGTVADGGAPPPLGTAASKAASDDTKSSLASVSGTIVAGNLAVFADTSGTVRDGGSPNAAAGRKVTAGGNVTMVADDQKILLAKATPAMTTVNFDPAGLVPYKTYEVMDGLGNAFNFPFTIAPATGTINGQASVSIGANWGSIRFFTDGTDTYVEY